MWRISTDNLVKENERTSASTSSSVNSAANWSSSLNKVSLGAISGLDFADSETGTGTDGASATTVVEGPASAGGSRVASVSSFWGFLALSRRLLLRLLSAGVVVLEEEAALLLLSEGAGGSTALDEEAGGDAELAPKAANMVDSLEELESKPETLGRR